MHKDKIAEKIIFEKFAHGNIENVSPVFIVGGPRTGSTLLYQILSDVFSLSYISNLTNDFFCETPILGILATENSKYSINYRSSFGKTKEIFGTSEGSAVLMQWFGGGHPSELKSSDFIESKINHCISTMLSVFNITKKDLIIKNPWNSFRIKSIQKNIPNAKFVWIKRDIVSAASSDLEARYITKNNPYEWNSATPRNLEVLMSKGYIEQVVENQYEFSRSIKEQFSFVSERNKISICYEDLVVSPLRVVKVLENFLGLKSIRKPSLKMIEGSNRKKKLDQKDIEEIEKYFFKNKKRLIEAGI